MPEIKQSFKKIIFKIKYINLRTKVGDIEKIMYLLKKTGRNLYVAKPGRHNSYTNSIRHAEKFSTKEDAIKNSCIENEFPVEVSGLID